MRSDLLDWLSAFAVGVVVGMISRLVVELLGID